MSYPDPTKIFTKIFRQKAHPEKKLEEAIIWIRKEIRANFQDLVIYFNAIQMNIENLSKKVDVILNIKKLKEKVEDL